MKLNDIYTNLKKDINLSSNKGTKNFRLNSIEKNIESFKINLNQIIKINKTKQILLNKAKSENIDYIKKPSNKNINLKKIIENQKFINKTINKLKDILFISKSKKEKTVKNSKKIKKYTITMIYLLIFDFLLANIFFGLSIYNLNSISNNNYENKVENSYISSTIANILYFPFKIIPISKLNNLIEFNSIIKNTDFIFITYINIFKQHKKHKLFTTDIINLNKTKIQKTKINTQNILKSINKIKLDRNSKYNYKINYFGKIITKLDLLLKDNSNLDIINNILGQKKIKKYMILFQNNDELRATGGFPGSVGIVSLYKGKIIDFKKEDIYNLEWNINKEYKKKIPAPYGLDKINPHLTLKDSNFFSSYFQSANSINFFLQKGEYQMDGIIFINTNTINKILSSIGGIDFKIINEKINKDNFNEIISILVEAKISKEGTLGTPKKVLFDFAKILEEKIKKSNNLKKVANIILDDIENREIAIILFNKQENELIRKIGLNGEIDFNKYTNFIYPVFTSLSQNKSDRYLHMSYNIKTEKIREKNNKCRYINNFQLKLKHNFSDTDKERLLKNFEKYKITNQSEKLLDIQGQGKNKQFIKIILPKGSIISSKQNLKIGKIGNSNLVTFFTDIAPQKEKSYSFNYILKNQDCNNYVFSLIKQPGIKKYNIHHSFEEENGNIIENIILEDLNKDFYINIEKQRILSINR